MFCGNIVATRTLIRWALLLVTLLPVTISLIGLHLIYTHNRHIHSLQSWERLFNTVDAVAINLNGSVSGLHLTPLSKCWLINKYNIVISFFNSFPFSLPYLSWIWWVSFCVCAPQGRLRHWIKLIIANSNRYILRFKISVLLFFCSIFTQVWLSI